MAIAIVIALLLGAPLGVTARPGGGGGGGGARPSGGGGRPAPAFRPSAPAASTRPAGGSGGGGFNFNQDVNGGKRPTTPPSGGSMAHRPNTQPANRPNVNNTNINRNVNVNNVNVNRTVVVNPVYRGPAWGWNRGVAWYPAPNYWGGGFWGAFAIGVTTAAIYGSIVNTTTHQTVTSYQVALDSPGATLLQNYGLTQTQCGPPNLVVIYGPNNSVICAIPNSTVTTGSYSLDTSNLSIVSL